MQAKTKQKASASTSKQVSEISWKKNQKDSIFSLKEKSYNLGNIYGWNGKNIELGSNWSIRSRDRDRTEGSVDALVLPLLRIKGLGRKRRRLELLDRLTADKGAIDGNSSRCKRHCRRNCREKLGRTRSREAFLLLLLLLVILSLSFSVGRLQRKRRWVEEKEEGGIRSLFVSNESGYFDVIERRWLDFVFN